MLQAATPEDGGGLRMYRRRSNKLTESALRHEAKSLVINDVKGGGLPAGGVKTRITILIMEQLTRAKLLRNNPF